MKRIITLTTDFGYEDHYVGSMRGVILSINREAIISDIAHNLPKYDIVKAAFMIPNFIKLYPKDAIHVVVVDPGVGTNRKPIVIETEIGTFIGPDNGVFSIVLENCGDYNAFEVSNKEYMLENVSSTFHGRDIFAPAAGHISNGIDAKKFGQPIEAPTMLNLPVPIVHSKTIDGQIIYTDSFGNLITNITQDMTSYIKEIHIGEFAIDTVAKSYQDVVKGELLAIIGSSGFLEISVNQGDASKIIQGHKSVKIIKL